jgi:hypothetical protein
MNFQELLAKMAQLDQPMAETAEVVAEAPVTECPAEMTPAAPSAPEPSLSVNLNAQGLNNIADLIKLIAKAEEGSEEEHSEMPEMPALAITAPGMSLSGDEQGPEELPKIDLDNTDDEKPKDEWANTPEPEVDSIDTMVNKLAGGLNEPKQMYKRSYKQGDNPMAMPENVDLIAQIRAELQQRLAEVKGAK